MTITITDAGRVLVDARDIGTIYDAVFNQTLPPEDVQAAVVARLDALKAETTASDAKYQAILAKLADPEASKDDAANEAKKSERQRRLDELTKARDAAQAALDEAARADADPAEVSPAVPAVP